MGIFIIIVLRICILNNQNGKHCVVGFSETEISTSSFPPKNPFIIVAQFWWNFNLNNNEKNSCNISFFIERPYIAKLINEERKYVLSEELNL